MITVEQAIKMIKNADAFHVEDENFTGDAEKLTLDKVKLVFVNQFRDGCEILQPVYTFTGTVENAGGSSAYTARIIAIPEKYTHP